MTERPADSPGTEVPAQATPEPTRTASAGASPSLSITRGFLFADLRGYTDFIERYGDAAAVELLATYRRLVREVVRTSGGAEIKTEGDSFYVVFPSASAAMQGGLAIISAAAQESADHPQRPIRVGVGIHAGESTETAEGYVGSSVNIAARVCAQAQAGEVLVTDTVRSLIRTSLPVALISRGKRPLKGIAEPIALYAVGAALPGATQTTGATAGRIDRRLGGLIALGALGLVVVLAAGAVLLRGGAGASPSPAPSSAATAGPIAAVSPSAGAGPTTSSRPTQQPTAPLATPESTLIPTPSPTPAPVAVERLAYTSEYVTPNEDPCTDSFQEAHTWIAAPDGSSPVRLLPTSDFWDRLATWSPDGSRIVVASTDQTGGANLYVVDAAGSHARALLPLNPDQASLNVPTQKIAWSPDGLNLATFDNEKDTGETVYLIKVADGTTRVVVTSPQKPPGAIVGDVAFMPDGRLSMAYLGSDGSLRLYAVNVDGTGWSPITGAIALSAIAIAWSPDGSMVAMEGQVPAALVPGVETANTGGPGPTGSPAPELGPPAVWVMNADGRGLHMLTTGSLPTWSPDGSKIAFVDGAGKTREVFAISPTGSDRTQVTDLGPDAAACSVSWTSTLAALAGPAPSPAPGATPAPIAFHIGRLDAGSYLVDKFQPNMEMTFPSGWLGRRDYPDGWSVGLVGDAPAGELDNARIQVGLTGPCPDAEQVVIGPKPADLVTWFQSRKDLAVTNPHAVNIGGHTGISIDVTGVGKGCTNNLPPPLIGHHWLFEIGQDGVHIVPDEVTRFLAIDVNGLTVTLQVDSFKPSFAAFAAAAQAILDSIRFPSP